MGIIDTAVSWAVDIANNDSYAYVWGGWGDSDGGYDCGHFVITAYKQAGIDTGATYTGDMYRRFISKGFLDVTASCDLSTGSGLKKGDILLNTEKHAAMVQIDGGTTVEARGRNYGIVSDVPYRNYPWEYVLRYPVANDAVQSITSFKPTETGTIQGVPYGQNADQLFNNYRYGVYKDLFEKYGKQYNVDPNLLAAIAMQESSLTDVSTGPAQGVMQIEYVLLDENEGYPNGWLSFAAYGRKVYGTAWTSSDRVDANKCIEYAAYVIDQGLKYYNGDLLKAVQQYNYSHYTVDELIRKYGDNWFTTGRASKAGYGDGQYVEHVFRYWQPNSLDGRYANPSLEEYAYSENSYAAEGEEQTVIWNNRVKENIQPRLNGITNIIPQNDELCIYVENNNISSYVGNLSWQNNISELATTLSFETPKTDAKYISNLIYIPKCGDVLRMVTDREVFRGVVISVDDGDKEVNQYTAVVV